MRRNDPIVHISGNLKITTVIGLIKLCKTRCQIWGTIELHTAQRPVFKSALGVVKMGTPTG